MAVLPFASGQPQPLPDPNKSDRPASPGAPTPYIQRRIDVTLSLGTGDFGEAGKNVITLRGKRCSVTVTKAQIGAQTVCELRIWGMAFKQMKALSTLGRKYEHLRDNEVLIQAGDDLAGMSTVFEGTINEGFFDGSSQPDVAFHITATEGQLYLLKPAPPISVAGAADVSAMMAQLAKQMGATFEDHGVTAKLRDVYYPGTAYQQARRIAEHAGINWTLEKGVLAIWPRGLGRDVGTVPLITPLSGLKDYPTFNQMGVIVTCLFRVISLGQKIAIKSSLWDNELQYFFVYTYTYTLESEMPNGPWFATFMASTEPISQAA